MLVAHIIILKESENTIWTSDFESKKKPKSQIVILIKYE